MSESRCWGCCQENCDSGPYRCTCRCHGKTEPVDLSPNKPGLDPETKRRRTVLEKMKHAPVEELIKVYEKTPSGKSILPIETPCRSCGLMGAHFCLGDRFPENRKWMSDVIRSTMESAVHGCQDHKRYQGKRKPRVPCEGCWRIWIALNPG